MTQASTIQDTGLLESMALKIIEEQERIIGPIAIEQAQSVSNLHLKWEKKEHHIEFSGNPSSAINELIKKYSELFGKLSVEVCRSASSDLLSKLPQDQIPNILK